MKLSNGPVHGVGIIAIKNNGELWGFGANWVGQLGIGPQQQVEITRNTIDLNGDGLGGINSVNNVSAADAFAVEIPCSHSPLVARTGLIHPYVDGETSGMGVILR